jgi:hypothetical protein
MQGTTSLAAKGTFQWQIRMYNDPSDLKKHGTPVYDVVRESHGYWIAPGAQRSALLQR